MSDQLVELKNTVKIKQTTISELKECLHRKDSKNEHLKSKIVDFTTVQNLRAQVKELLSENEHLKSKAVDFITFETLQVKVTELKSVNESLNLTVEELSKVRGLVEANLRERDELIYDQCEKMRLLKEQSEPFYETIISSTFEAKNLELIKEIRDKMKCFDEEKKSFETKISKLEKVLAQRVKDFDDVKTELSKRTDKFETYFANLEKQNALLKSQLASQNYTSLQKENNDLRTSYNVMKEKYETSCEKLEKENNELKIHYKRLFDSIKQKKVDSQVFTKSIPKVNVSEKIYTGKSLKPILKKVYQFTTYSLQKDRKYLKKQHSSKTFASQNHVKNERLKQAWKRKENISKPFKYSMDEMFSMRKKNDSVLKKVKDVRFLFILKRKLFQNETSSFNSK
nr:outer membrane protein porin [Tanacetum cinerariifolium]